MGYSSQTTHYGLPLPVGSDKSTFLDTNEAFTAVDTALYGAVTGQAQVETDVQNLNNEITGIQSDITGIQSDISGLQNGLASTNLLVQEHAEDISGLENDMDSAEGSISAINTKLTDYLIVQQATDLNITTPANDVTGGGVPCPVVQGYKPILATIASTGNSHISFIGCSINVSNVVAYTVFNTTQAPITHDVGFNILYCKA